MAIAAKMKGFLDKGSMIRKMFEEGARLRKIHGADKVFDFSLGNPNLPPPAAVRQRLAALAAADEPGLHAYMPNAGLDETRAAIAARVSADHGVALKGEHIVVTCGAAGALNIIFKTLLDPGDEVLVPTPYFVEYGFIADNHGGLLKPVPTKSDFSLDVAAMEAAMGPRTKIVLINSPNNPTGQIYSAASLGALAAAMARKAKRARPRDLPRVGRALSQDSLWRRRRAQPAGRIWELDRRDLLLEGALPPRRANRLRRGKSRGGRSGRPDGRPHPREPHPRLRQRAEPHAEGRGGHGRRHGGRVALPGQA